MYSYNSGKYCPLFAHITDIDLVNFNPTRTSQVCFSFYKSHLTLVAATSCKTGVLPQDTLTATTDPLAATAELMTLFLSSVTDGQSAPLPTPAVQCSSSSTKATLATMFSRESNAIFWDKWIAVGKVSKEAAAVLPKDKHLTQVAYQEGQDIKVLTWISIAAAVLAQTMCKLIPAAFGFNSEEEFSLAVSSARQVQFIAPLKKVAFANLTGVADMDTFIGWWLSEAKAYHAKPGLNTLLLLLPPAVGTLAAEFTLRSKEQGSTSFSEKCEDTATVKAMQRNLAMWMASALSPVTVAAAVVVSEAPPTRGPSSIANNTVVPAQPTQEQRDSAAREAQSDSCRTCRGATGHTRFTCPKYHCRGCGMGPTPGGLGHIWRCCPTHPGGPPVL